MRTLPHLRVIETVDVQAVEIVPIWRRIPWLNLGILAFFVALGGLFVYIDLTRPEPPPEATNWYHQQCMKRYANYPAADMQSICDPLLSRSAPRNYEMCVDANAGRATREVLLICKRKP